MGGYKIGEYENSRTPVYKKRDVTYDKSFNGERNHVKFFSIAPYDRKWYMDKKFLKSIPIEQWQYYDKTITPFRENFRDKNLAELGYYEYKIDKNNCFDYNNIVNEVKILTNEQSEETGTSWLQRMKESSLKENEIIQLEKLDSDKINSTRERIFLIESCYIKITYNKKEYEILLIPREISYWYKRNDKIHQYEKFLKDTKKINADKFFSNFNIPSVLNDRYKYLSERYKKKKNKQQDEYSSKVKKNIFKGLRWEAKFKSEMNNQIIKGNIYSHLGKHQSPVEIKGKSFLTIFTKVILCLIYSIVSAIKTTRTELWLGGIAPITSATAISVWTFIGVMLASGILSILSYLPLFLINKILENKKKASLRIFLYIPKTKILINTIIYYLYELVCHCILLYLIFNIYGIIQ